MKYLVNDKEVSRNEFVKRFVKNAHECYQQSCSRIPVNERIAMHMIELIEHGGCGQFGGVDYGEPTKFEIASEEIK